jgi:VWFA-related protein
VRDVDRLEEGLGSSDEESAHGHVFGCTPSANFLVRALARSRVVDMNGHHRTQEREGHRIGSGVCAAVTGVVTFALAAAVAAQSPQAPVFRSGVELLEIDATVVDARSRPVGDLRTSDFVVTVDGKPRRVVSAEFAATSDIRSRPAGESAAAVAPVTFNNGPRDGRLIVFAIDQLNTRPGQSRAVALAVERFLDRLSPDDRVALFAFPAPGPTVDFTTSRMAIRDGLALVSGTGDFEPIAQEFSVSRSEAVAVESQTDFETIRRLVWRECRVEMPENMMELMVEMVSASGCEGTVIAEAGAMAIDIYRRSDGAVTALSQLLRRLGSVDGRKSLVLVSEGLALPGLRSEAVPMLAELAAAARVDVNVILPQTLGDTDADRHGFRPTRLADQRLQEDGLESLAVRSRGTLFRAPSGLDGAFERVGLELSGYYVLGVETAPSDRNGDHHRIGVQVRRRGVTVRARREFRYEPGRTFPPEDAMTRLLRSPFPVPDLPIRLATYAFRDPALPKTRVVLAAEIGPAGTGAVDLTLGFGVFDAEGRVVASGRDRKTLESADGRAVEYDGSILLDPGIYTLRFAAIDPDGNRGSVERQLQLTRPANQPLAIGDLMLARANEAAARALKPRVELRVDARRFAAYMELYADKPGKFEGAEVDVEVARDESSTAIRRDRAPLQPRGDGRRGEVLLSIPVDGLAPGHYVVRATVTLDGRTVATSVRPFELVPWAVTGSEDSVTSSSSASPGAAEAALTFPSGCPGSTQAAPAPRWVPFEASFTRTDPLSSRKIVGRFRRASDGSTREETDVDDPVRAIVAITNLARCVQYQFVNGAWSSYPVKLPPDGFGPQAVPEDPHRFLPAPAVEGFEVLRFVNAQGIALFQAPRLDYFALATENPAGGREVFSSIKQGEQSADWFEPPEGSAIEARADWRGALFYPVSQSSQPAGR